MTLAPTGRLVDGPTATFARWVTTTRFEDLPAAVMEAVKDAILDTVGVGVAGAHEPAPRALAATIARIGGPPAASIVGWPRRTDPASAALVNGTLMHALDYDDVSFATSAHPSVSLLPAILALAESEGLGGRDAITAYATGLEAAMLLGRLMNPGHYGHGFHGTGTIGTMAATFAATNLLGLNETQAAHAIAIAASSAAGLRGNFGTDTKPLHAGQAGRSGVMASLLAREGLTGSPDILERRFGLLEVLTPPGSRPTAWPAGGLGERWGILDPGILRKVFPSCASTHASVGSILDLRAGGLRPEDVDTIDVALTDLAAANLPYADPATGLQAKFSLPYCVARALDAGTLGLEDFTDEAVARNPVRDLMTRITVRPDEGLTREYRWGEPRPSVMTVRTRSGEVLHHRTDAAPGAPGRTSREMLLAKARDTLGRGSIAGTPDQVIDAVASLEARARIDELMALLRGREP